MAAFFSECDESECCFAIRWSLSLSRSCIDIVIHIQLQHYDEINTNDKRKQKANDYVGYAEIFKNLYLDGASLGSMCKVISLLPPHFLYLNCLFILVIIAIICVCIYVCICRTYIMWL